ncbi:hypothetical protein B0T10DRAFT_522396 [Thelonectria olida]|uniref:NAD-dependent epimerase/dehydratase domain-containing protein n=1 Tax=Thelonectria olida TaxID=1576542 RepID=A0A9P8VRW0_9HYPO|nr:hypothetical protein B0T10DRAFT_522396 [Thelonectria olida]
MTLPNILLTGASGYLGGTLLDHLATTNLPPHGKIYALVRNVKQAEAVKKYSAEPLLFDPYDKAAVEKHIFSGQISIVFWLIDALGSTAQPYFIEALSKLKQQIGHPVHFLHTSGAKIFSSLAGAVTDQPLLDNDPNLYDVQKNQRAPHDLLQQAVETNNQVIELSEAKGVRSYIFVPCIVYGKGEGFGNVISIQTVAIVKAALAAKRVHSVDTDHPTWPVSHIQDTAMLYAAILRNILAEEYPDYGKKGYYLASSGSVAWDDLYDAMAKALAKRGVIEDSGVTLADDASLAAMARGLKCPQPLVQVQLGGKCTFTAKHGESLGWKSQYPAEHILEAADAEVELILKNL